jgi:hypothetical protein
MDDKRDVIFNIQNLKETEELIEIWQKSDREEWSEEALGVIREILSERLGYLPEVLNPEELIDEYTPEFYSPKEVDRLTKWLQFLPIPFLCVIILRQILTFGELRSIVSSVMYGLPIMISFVSILFFFTNIIISIVLYIIPMIILKVILKIILQMEMNSRKTTVN